MDSPNTGGTLEGYRLQEQTARSKKRLKPGRFSVERCTLGCSINPRNMPGELGKLVHEWYESAYNDDEIHEMALRASADKVNLSIGALHRHRKNHLVRVFDGDERAFDSKGDDDEPEEKKLTHIQILELIIQRGANSLPVGRISPELTLKAMDMHFKMTQGSAIDSTLQAIAAAMSGSQDEDGVPLPTNEFGTEDDDALMTDEEQEASEVIDE